MPSSGISFYVATGRHIGTDRSLDECIGDFATGIGFVNAAAFPARHRISRSAESFKLDCVTTVGPPVRVRAGPRVYTHGVRGAKVQVSDSSASASSWHLSQPFDRDLLVFDVETTGVNPRLHQIVSIGALLLDRTTLDTVKSMSSLVQLTPEAFAQASPKAMRIHGLTFSQLEAAPTPAEVVTRFLDTFGADFYFCGWNACFDTQFLRALFDQAGRLQDFDTFRYHRLDLWSLLELAWLRGLLQAPPDSLSIACGLFGIERPSVHDAMEDARVSALILRKTLPMLVGGRKEENMEPSSAAGKSGDDKGPASLEGSMDWRKLLNGWLKVAHEGIDMHYEAQRRFNKRGR